MQTIHIYSLQSKRLSSASQLCKALLMASWFSLALGVQISGSETLNTTVPPLQTRKLTIFDWLHMQHHAADFMIFNDFQCLYHLPYLVLWNSWHSIQGLEAESQAAFAHSWGRARMDGWEDFGWNFRKEQFLDKKLCGIWVRIGDPVSPKGFPPKIKRFDWSDA